MIVNVMLPTWGLLQQVFTVETIMTPRAGLFVWREGDDLAPVREEAIRRRYDLIPKTNGGGRIVGVFLPRQDREAPLTDRWLVSRDTAIPDLLALFIETERPSFLVLHRQDVVGIVAPADLNKVPARVYVYNLIAELEMGLAALVRRHMTPEALREYVDKPDSADLDPIHQLQLSQLVTIVSKDDALRTLLGFGSLNQAKRALNGLVKCRNDVMHPVRPMTESNVEALKQLYEHIQRASNVIGRLNDVFDTYRDGMDE